MDEFLGEGEVGPNTFLYILELGFKVVLPFVKLVYKPFLNRFLKLVRFVQG